MSWEWVDSNTGLAEAIAHLSGAEVVAVDTEFRRRDTYFPQVALVQLASTERCFLIDPLCIDDPSPLRQLLLDPNTIKLLHSPSEDLEVFEFWLGALPTPLFDSQRAAAMLGMGFGLGYRGLVEALLGVSLDKEETQSDWLQRPLSEAQCHYAAQDVTYLMQCWPLIKVQAEQSHCFSWVLEDGSFMATGGRGPLAKFKSAGRLAPVQLATLAALVDWREQEARKRDKPRSWILADKVVQTLAMKRPRNRHQLAATENMPAGVVRRSGDELLAMITAASEDPDWAVPPALPPASAAVRNLAKYLSGEIENLASTMGMNPEVLMPSREVELLAREQCGEVVESPRHWQGWRGKTVLSPLRALAETWRAQHEAG